MNKNNVLINSIFSNTKPLAVMLISFMYTLFAIPALGAESSSPSPDTAKASAQTSLNVIVSLKPIYGLVCALTKGITQPTLLTASTQSAHTLSLSSHDIRRLSQADAVIWAGPAYELVMAKALSLCVEDTKLFTCQEAPGLKLLPIRRGALFPGCACTHHTATEDNQPHEHVHTQHDGHFWLDIANAKVIANHLHDRLLKVAPHHEKKLQDNLEKLLVDLDKFEEVLKHLLTPINGKAALADHDSLQYFEQNYGFSIRGVLVADDGVPPSLKHIQLLTQELDTNIDEKIITAFLYTKSAIAHAPQLVEKLANPYNLPVTAIDYDGSMITCAQEDHHQYYQLILMTLAKQLLTAFQVNTAESPVPLKPENEEVLSKKLKTAA